MADEKTPEQASQAVGDAIRGKEAERILKYVKEDAYVITLEIQGQMLTSEELADKINHLGEKPYYIYYRWFYWIGTGGFETIGLCSKFFKNDISSSVDEGDTVGTGVSELSNYIGGAIS